MSVFPTGDKAVKMLLAASRNYVKIWGDLPKSLRHGLCQWNFLAKCHNINTQYSVICRISSPPRSTIFYLNLSLGRGWQISNILELSLHIQNQVENWVWITQLKCYFFYYCMNWNSKYQKILSQLFDPKFKRGVTKLWKLLSKSRGENPN